MNIKAGDVVVHKLGERLLVLYVGEGPYAIAGFHNMGSPGRSLKCRRENFDTVEVKEREILHGDTRPAQQYRSTARGEYAIFGILSRLEDVWERHPQLRLGQLIGNVFNYALGKDPYNVEDEAFIFALEEFYGKEGGVQ